MGGGLPSGCGKLGGGWEINAKAQRGKGAKGGRKRGSARRHRDRGGREKRGSFCPSGSPPLEYNFYDRMILRFYDFMISHPSPTAPLCPVFLSLSPLPYQFSSTKAPGRPPALSCKGLQTSVKACKGLYGYARPCKALRGHTRAHEGMQGPARPCGGARGRVGAWCSASLPRSRPG